jgi:hypothetical protein
MAANSTPQRIDFVGVGANKCGTTWIYKCLEEHPEICMGRPKEIHYFSSKDNTGRNVHSKGIDFYFSHFSHCESDRLIGEVGPKYFTDPHAAENIQQHFPDVKILISIRHPIDRALSGYNHQASKYGEDRPYASFSDAVADPAFLDKHIRYYDDLKRFFDRFPRENIYVGIYEQLKENPKEFIQDMYRFLGVDDTFVPPSVDVRYNAASQRYDTKNRAIKRKLFKVYRFLKEIPVVSGLLRYAKKQGVHSTVLKTVDQQTLKDSSVPQVPQAVHEQLKDEVTEEISAIESLIGTSIPEWQGRYADRSNQ